MAALEKCENCGRTIGKLETPNLWDNHVVCAKCYETLSKAPASAPPIVIEDENFAPQKNSYGAGFSSKTNSAVPARRCPICGSTAAPIKKNNGSIVVAVIGLGLGILLLSTGSGNDFGLGLLFFLIGLVAAITGAGRSWICPQCKTKLGKI